jgi:hypothetical protein
VLAEAIFSRWQTDQRPQGFCVTTVDRNLAQRLARPAGIKTAQARIVCHGFKPRLQHF